MLSSNSRRCGVSLFELLTVMAIAIALFAFLLPKLRIATKESRIKEAANIVQARLSESQSLAKTKKTLAGIRFVRNENFSYGSTTITGVVGNVRRIKLNPNNEVTMTLLVDRGNRQYLGHMKGLQGLFEVGDQISWAEGKLTFTFLGNIPCVGYVYEVSGTGEEEVGKEYVIAEDTSDEEEAVITTFSDRDSVQLPRGTMVDMRYSGKLDRTNHDDDEETLTWFNLVSQTGVQRFGEVTILFGKSGRIEYVLAKQRGEFGDFENIFLPDSSVDLLVRGYDENENLTDINSPEVANKILREPDSVWVSVNHIYGTVDSRSVGNLKSEYSNPFTQLDDARRSNPTAN